MNMEYGIVRDEWNADSDEYYKRAASEREVKRVMLDPSCAFPKEVFAMIRSVFPDLRGKRVIVPSSGDNMAVIGFHLLGAKVTSMDIAERQLYNAQLISKKYGWYDEIDYRIEDSMVFNGVESEAYDLVYTSNGVHVWISDLVCMYRNFHRVLKKGGMYIMFELHPVNRPIGDKDNKIVARKPYEEIGPIYGVEGGAPNYHWRTQDMVNGVVEAGFSFMRLEEFHADKDALVNFNCWYDTAEAAREDAYRKYDWKINEFAVLPEWVGLCARK
jgi:SAM-dependent methyltransferase